MSGHHLTLASLGPRATRMFLELPIAGAALLCLSFAIAALAHARQPAEDPAVGQRAAVAAPAGPSTSEAPTSSLAAFAARLKAQHPGTRIDSVGPSPVAGLYEVVMGRNVAYVDAGGRYFVFGHVFDMTQQRDLTADRKAALARIDVKALPPDLAITHVRGTGASVLYVFADPTCGFCRQLEQALAGMTDITVHTFVVPLLGPEAKRIATALACSASPAAAWSAWMLKGEDPGAATCQAGASRVAATERLAASLGVTGTPTLVAADGRQNAGFMSADRLTAWLAAAAPVQPAAAPAPGPAAHSVVTTPKTAR